MPIALLPGGALRLRGAAPGDRHVVALAIRSGGELLLDDPGGAPLSDDPGDALLIDRDQLAVAPDTIRRATSRLRRSPLHDLVRDHLRMLWGNADRLAADPGAPALGAATVGLVRALIVSAAGAPDLVPAAGVPDRAAAGEESLAGRALAFAAGRLGDPGLTPARIARALHVSPRLLYREFAAAGISLEQWIIRRRLEGARASLADPRLAHLTIAAIAARWGFAGPSFFTRRFRAAYGLTPREWRQRA